MYNIIAKTKSGGSILVETVSTKSQAMKALEWWKKYGMESVRYSIFKQKA